jgi:mannose-6-phosphate isomerase-like protein (cupin superfamily)
MSRYTVTNLRELEDQAPKFGMPEGMEARFAYRDLQSEQTGVSLQRYAPGLEQPFAHSHGEVEEIYVVVAGGGRIRLDGEDVEVGQWDAIRIAPGTVHAVAAGPDGIELLAFGPRGNNDAEMLEADWS